MADTTLTRKELRELSRALRAQGRKLPKHMRCVVLPESLGGKTVCHGGIPARMHASFNKDSTDFWVKK